MGQDRALCGRNCGDRYNWAYDLSGVLYANQKEVTQIVAQSGSHVNIEQKKEEKKSGVSVTPFVEGYGFAESDKRTGAGAKAGVRVDF